MENLSKILSHLKPYCKYNLTIDGVVHEIDNKKISLSPSFFYVDDCICCGRCCGVVAESLVLTASEYKRLQDCTDQEFIDYDLDVERLHHLKEAMVAENHTIDGKEVTIYKDPTPSQMFYIETKQQERKTCPYLFRNKEGLYRCGVHPVRSITCRVPHMRTFHSSRGNTSLGVSQYGRNWAVDCPIKFRECNDAEEFENTKKSRLDTLEYLLRVANELNIDTYLPEVIEYAKQLTFENHKQMLGKPILHTKRVKPLI